MKFICSLLGHKKIHLDFIPFRLVICTRCKKYAIVFASKSCEEIAEIAQMRAEHFLQLL